MTTISDATTTILVEDRNGKALLWMKTYADGFTTLNDVIGHVDLFDPNEEYIGDAVVRWMRSVNMASWLFTITWSGDALLLEGWARNDFRIYRHGPQGNIEHLVVWGASYDDALNYLANRLLPGMRIAY